MLLEILPFAEEMPVALFHEKDSPGMPLRRLPIPHLLGKYVQPAFLSGNSALARSRSPGRGPVQVLTDGGVKVTATVRISSGTAPTLVSLGLGFGRSSISLAMASIINILALFTPNPLHGIPAHPCA